MTPRRFPLLLTVICLLPLTPTRVDAALITWLEGFDSEFTVTRGNASWILHEGIPPGLLRLHGTGDSEDGKRRGRGHNRDEQAVIVHDGFPPGLLRPHPTGGAETGKNTGARQARDEEAVNNKTPPLSDAPDFDDIPGLADEITGPADDIELLEGGLGTPDPDEPLVLLHPDGDDPSSTVSSGDDATGLASVPEPGAMLLFMSAGVAWVTRSRQRRRATGGAAGC